MSTRRDLPALHRRIVSRLIDEVVNRRETDAVAELVHRDFFSHDAPASRASGPQGFAQTVRRLHEAFAGYRIDVKDMVAEGDKVVVRATASGRQVGKVTGVPPTGREWSRQEIHIFRLADGQVVEHWGRREGITALRQACPVGVSTRQPSFDARVDSGQTRTGRRSSGALLRGSLLLLLVVTGLVATVAVFGRGASSQYVSPAGPRPAAAAYRPPTAKEFARLFVAATNRYAREHGDSRRIGRADCVQATAGHYMCAYTAFRPGLPPRCQLMQARWTPDAASTITVTLAGRTRRCRSVRDALDSF